MSKSPKDPMMGYGNTLRPGVGRHSPEYKRSRIKKIKLGGKVDKRGGTNNNDNPFQF